nr:hypothetical protein CFP56_05277 [Quercus suber]
MGELDTKGREGGGPSCFQATDNSLLGQAELEQREEQMQGLRDTFPHDVPFLLSNPHECWPLEMATLEHRP